MCFNADSFFLLKYNGKTKPNGIHWIEQKQLKELKADPAKLPGRGTEVILLRKKRSKAPAGDLFFAKGKK